MSFASARSNDNSTLDWACISVINPEASRAHRAEVMEIFNYSKVTPILVEVPRKGRELGFAQWNKHP